MPVPLTLKVFKGENLVAAKDYERDIIKIGRLSSAHLCLADEKVSRIHAVIEVGSDGAMSIIDMGSVEGTFVNGKRVNKGALAFGDEIRVGNTTIKAERTQPKSVPLGAASAEDPTNVTSVRPTVIEPPPPPPEATAVQPLPAAVPQPPAAVAKQPPEPEPTKRPARAGATRRGTGPLGLELRLMWGDTRVGEYFLDPRGKRRRLCRGLAQPIDGNRSAAGSAPWSAATQVKQRPSPSTSGP